MGESGAEDMGRNLAAFLRASTWSESEKVLDAHPEVADDAGVAMLDQLIADTAGAAMVYPELDPAAAAGLLRQHRLLLTRSRAVGTRRALEETVGTDRVRLLTIKTMMTGGTSNGAAPPGSQSSPGMRPAKPPTRPAPFVPPEKRARPAPRILGGLAGVVVAAAGAWLGKIAALQVNDDWISPRLGAAGPASLLVDRWILLPGVLLLVLGTTGGIAAWGVNAGLRTISPTLRGASGTRALIVVAVLLSSMFVGVRVVPPPFLPGDVLFAAGPPNGTVVAREDFAGGAPPWSTRLGMTVGVFMKAGGYHVRVKAKPGSSLGDSGSLEWGVGVTRPTSTLPALPADVRVDVSARPVQGAEFAYGVVCRYQSPARFYRAVLGSDGAFRVDKQLDGRVVTLAGGRVEPGVIDLAAPVRLQLACVGGQDRTPVRLVLWANGRRLVQATDRGTPLFSGSALVSGVVGVCASSAVDFSEVTFDDIALTAL